MVGEQIWIFKQKWPTFKTRNVMEHYGQTMKYKWLVVWNMNYMTFHSVGNGKSSQLTNSLHHFSEGLAATTNQIMWVSKKKAGKPPSHPDGHGGMWPMLFGSSPWTVTMMWRYMNSNHVRWIFFGYIYNEQWYAENIYIFHECDYVNNFGRQYLFISAN